MNNMNIKRALTAIGIAMALQTGCATSTEQRIRNCEHAQALLAGYQSAVDSGLVVDKDAIAAGKVAAAYLNVYCGWTTVKTRGSSQPALDKNGVLLVVAPR